MSGRATSPLLLIAAGGTGGHMFPAQALAEQMLARGWRVRLSTDARGAHYATGFPAAVERQVVRAGTFAREGLTKLVAPFQIFAGTAAAIAAMRRDRPACVAGFGGYPALPAMAAAWTLGRPRLVHEQNAVLGRVNQLFAGRVDRVACGMWPTALPDGARGVHTGNPVRAAIAARAGAPYAAPGDGTVRLLVIGGSQGARLLSQAVPAALAALPDALRARLEVSHQARPEDRDAVVAAYAGAGIQAEVSPFFDDVPRAHGRGAARRSRAPARPRSPTSRRSVAPRSSSRWPSRSGTSRRPTHAAWSRPAPPSRLPSGT